tara:strand:+ start:57752 stop:58504 length:753 start_codon:yes stop_codon:yes gene_type:complete
MYKPIELNHRSLGTWISTGNLLVLEAILEMNVYDWIAVDLEHSAFTEPEILNIFATCQRFGIHAFARLHGHDPLQGRKMLDIGATGLIIPVVNSGLELDELCKHFFYPPKGKRGVCLSRINKFGDSFDEYFQTFQPIIVPQIESAKAVNNISEICKREYVKAVFLGPYDLSADLGTPGKFDSSAVVDALTKVKNEVLKTRVKLGMHVVQPDAEVLKKKFEEGYSFVAYGTDIILLKSALTSAKSLKGSLK